MRQRMKPDERELLEAFADAGGRTSGASTSLRAVGASLDMPPKRVCYLASKWSAKGWYDWGVTVDMGWLEPAGWAAAHTEESG